jgi:hypothetical protein
LDYANAIYTDILFLKEEHYSFHPCKINQIILLLKKVLTTYYKLQGFKGIMEVVITARTDKGQRPTEEDIKRTMEEALQIAHLLNGMVVYGKGFSNGTQVVVEIN